MSLLGAGLLLTPSFDFMITQQIEDSAFLSLTLRLYGSSPRITSVEMTGSHFYRMISPFTSSFYRRNNIILLVGEFFHKPEIEIVVSNHPRRAACLLSEDCSGNSIG